MPAGASPNIRPVRSVPAGKALQVGHPLHFLLAACGVGGGARGHLVATPSFLSSATVPVTSFNSCARNSFVTGRGVGSGSLTVLRNHPLFRSVLSPFPFWRGARQPLLLPGQQRIENVGGSSSSSWFYRAVFGSTFMAAEGGTSSIPSMSGSSSNRTSSSGDVDEDGGTGSTAPLKAGPGSPTASGGGGRGGGEAGGREDFPIVTMDPDAVQKFAEIEVWWGDDKSSEPTILIRGLKSAEYHVEAAEPTMVRLREAGAEATITGGGRVKHSSKRRSIFIYGYSMQFGPANLPRVADLCRKQFGPEYEVTWTEGGY